MRPFQSVVLSAILFFTLLHGLTPSTANAQSHASVATVTLYHDSDINGVFGSAGDHVIDSKHVGTDGAFSLRSNRCINCAIVIHGWGWDDPDVDSIGGNILGDGAAPEVATATMWLDSDSNGVFGTAGDTEIAVDGLDSLGDYTFENISFQDSAVVIDGWDWDDPEIDVVRGTLNGWGWDDPDVDGGFGDDKRGLGFGDDELDWGFGDDEIDWGFGDDEIDWGFGDDEIDWGFGDDEVDAILTD